MYHAWVGAPAPAQANGAGVKPSGPASGPAEPCCAVLLLAGLGCETITTVGFDVTDVFGAPKTIN